MAVGFNVSLRNSRLDSITSFAGSGALLRIYSGTRPGTGGTATTLLAELVCGTPFAPAAATATLTLGSIANDASADSTGTASWFRIVKSDGTTHVMDGAVGTTGSDLNMVTTSITAGQPVAVTSFVINEANA